MRNLLSQDKDDWKFHTLPIWRLHAVINLNVMLRPICRRKGHVRDIGFGIGAAAPIYCRRCWKTLDYV